MAKTVIRSASWQLVGTFSEEFFMSRERRLETMKARHVVTNSFVT